MFFDCSMYCVETLSECGTPKPVQIGFGCEDFYYYESRPLRLGEYGFYVTDYYRIRHSKFLYFERRLFRGLLIFGVRLRALVSLIRNVLLDFGAFF